MPTQARAKRQKIQDVVLKAGPANSNELFDWPTWLVADMFADAGLAAALLHKLLAWPLCLLSACDHLMLPT